MANKLLSKVCYANLGPLISAVKSLSLHGKRGNYGYKWKSALKM